MHRETCSLVLAAPHDCPSRFIDASSENFIPMYHWVSRQVILCPKVVLSLLHLQHLIAGRILNLFQRDISTFAEISNAISANINVSGIPHDDPASLAHKAIQDAADAIVDAHNKGEQYRAVKLSAEFLQTLPAHLTAIERATRNTCSASSWAELNQQQKTLEIWQKALEVLSKEENLLICCNDVDALQEHDKDAKLGLAQLFNFWINVSPKLLNIFSSPYSDNNCTVESIKLEIDNFCMHSNHFAPENFTELKTFLNTWQDGRKVRIEDDRFTEPLAAAYFYNEALQDAALTKDIIYFGLLLGLTFSDIQILIAPHDIEKTKTAILHKVLVNRKADQGYMDPVRDQQDIIKALYQCDYRVLAVNLAKKWQLPEPTQPPCDFIERFCKLEKNDTVPLVLAYELLRFTSYSYYDLGIALGFSIPQIESITNRGNSPFRIGQLQLLNRAHRTRRHLEQCMLHPAVNRPTGPMLTIRREIVPGQEWQPGPISMLNNNATSLLKNEHIHALRPVTDWFSFGYMLGVPITTLKKNYLNNYNEGEYTCFYIMLKDLKDLGLITISQLASIARRHGFEHTIQYLPDACKPLSYKPTPAKVFPHRHHQLTASLLLADAGKWKEISAFFQLSEASIARAIPDSEISDREKLIRVLDMVYQAQSREILDHSYYQLLATIGSSVTPEASLARQH